MERTEEGLRDVILELSDCKMCFKKKSEIVDQSFDAEEGSRFLRFCAFAFTLSS